MYKLLIYFLLIIKKYSTYLLSVVLIKTGIYQVSWQINLKRTHFYIARVLFGIKVYIVYTLKIEVPSLL